MLIEPQNHIDEEKIVEWQLYSIPYFSFKSHISNFLILNMGQKKISGNKRRIFFY